MAKSNNIEGVRLNASEKGPDRPESTVPNPPRRRQSLPPRIYRSNNGEGRSRRINSEAIGEAKIRLMQNKFFLIAKKCEEMKISWGMLELAISVKQIIFQQSDHYYEKDCHHKWIGCPPAASRYERG